MAEILNHEDRSDRFEAVMSLIKPHVSSILDLGCGIGSLAPLLAERFPSASILGIDRSRYLLEQSKCKGMKRGIIVVLGEAPLLPLKPKSFDIVVAVQVFHEIFHFMGKEKLISTIRNVYDLLREDGQFIVLDHRNPGDALISTCLPKELMERLHDFKLRFTPRNVSYETLDNRWIRMSMRDFYDFVTKIWSLGTDLEEEEMHETHTSFTEHEFANLCQKAGFKVDSVGNLTSISRDLDYYKIRVKMDLALPERHFVIDARKSSCVK